MDSADANLNGEKKATETILTTCRKCGAHKLDFVCMCHVDCNLVNRRVSF